MKTKLKPLSILSAISVSAFIAAAALPITSFSATSEPLDCGTLSKAIEQELIAKGVANYELSVIAKDDADSGRKVVGNCAAGTKKILYSRTKESLAAKVAAQESGEAPRETVIKIANKNSDTHQFIGTKKNVTIDPWRRTKEVWGLTFSPEFKYEIRVRPRECSHRCGHASARDDYRNSLQKLIAEERHATNQAG